MEDAAIFLQLCIEVLLGDMGGVSGICNLPQGIIAIGGNPQVDKSRVCLGAVYQLLPHPGGLAKADG